MRERKILCLLALVFAAGLVITYCTGRLLTTEQGTSVQSEAAAGGAEDESAADPSAGNGAAPGGAAMIRSSMDRMVPAGAAAGGAEKPGPDAGAAAEKAEEAEVEKIGAEGTGAAGAGAEGTDVAGAGAEGAGAEGAGAANPGGGAPILYGAGSGSGTFDAAGPADTAETGPSSAGQHVVISPLETTRAAEEAEEQEDSLLRPDEAPSPENPFRDRLKELDARIQRNRDSAASSSKAKSGGTGMSKNQASEELKLWDSELTSIYEELLDRLGSGQAESLAESQREWMKNRDAEAVEAARNSAGGSRESVEYTASMAASARARAYELVSLYENVLTGDGGEK